MAERKTTKDAPARLACLACRQKHLKCDARQPGCSRCLSQNLDCSYTASRRGYRGPSRQHIEKANGCWAPLDTIHVERKTARTDSSSTSADITYSRPKVILQEETTNNGSLTNEPTDVVVIPYTSIKRVDRMVQHYYEYFHAAHPFLLPMQQFVQEEKSPKYLFDTVRFIGSRYVKSQIPGLSKDEILSGLYQAPDSSIFKIQGLLLITITLHISNDLLGSLECLEKAVDLAFGIGLYSRCFASSNGYSDWTMQESIRRTWWELYVIDAMTAAFFNKDSFRTHSVTTDMELPCDDKFYSPDSPAAVLNTTQDLDNRFLDDTDQVFSSHSYRIEAAMLLRRVLAVAAIFDGQSEEIDAMDATLSAWFHHLPPEKYEILGSNGQCDEMMFQARMIVHAATTHLHLPRSTLQTARPRNLGLGCVSRCEMSAPASSYHTHTVKAVHAVTELTRLASLPICIFKHTPFFACGLVTCSVVLLSACAVNMCNCLHPHREQIIQCIEVLKSLGRIWELPQQSMTQIRSVAREIAQTGIKPFAVGSACSMQDSGTIKDSTGAPEIESVLDPSVVNMEGLLPNHISTMPCGWELSTPRS